MDMTTDSLAPSALALRHRGRARARSRRSGRWPPPSPSTPSSARPASACPSRPRGSRGSAARRSPCRATGTRAKIAGGEITDADLAAALAAAPAKQRPADLRGAEGRRRHRPARRRRRCRPWPTSRPRPAASTGRRSSRSGSAPGRRAFRPGPGALGRAAASGAPGAAWRTFATHDLTPEIVGLQGFARLRGRCARERGRGHRPGRADAGPDRRGARRPTSTSFCCRWAAGRSTRATSCGRPSLAGRATPPSPTCWPSGWSGRRRCSSSHDDAIGADWANAVAAHAAPLVADRRRRGRRASCRRPPSAPRSAGSPRRWPRDGRRRNGPTGPLQAAFCIDVRSEVFRRALEAVDPGIQTLGFAGFFGVFAAHHGFASDVAELRLPVLLNPTVRSTAGEGPGTPADTSAALRRPRQARLGPLQARRRVVLRLRRGDGAGLCRQAAARRFGHAHAARRRPCAALRPRT